MQKSADVRPFDKVEKNIIRNGEDSIKKFYFLGVSDYKKTMICKLMN